MGAVATRLIAITFADGSVGMMQFVTTELDEHGRIRWTRPASQENVDEELRRCAFDPGKRPIQSWRFVEDMATLPTDRAYRNAWVDNGAAVVHDMPKAREIHLQKLRAERAPVLAQLDGDWMREFATGNTAKAAEIEAQRAALRALPDVSGARTVDELKAIRLPTVAAATTVAAAASRGRP